MPFQLIRHDITKIKVDAIVNAANTSLQMGGGVCGAIFKAAGAAELQQACNQFAPINTGEAVITPGFRLPARYVIHTAGPVYKEGHHREDELLRSCYLNSLKRCLENGCASVAFPLISSGIYGYPSAEALQVASQAIKDFLDDHDLNVTLVVFNKAAFEISKDLLNNVEAFIDDHYVSDHDITRRSDQLLPIERDTIGPVFHQRPLPSGEQETGNLADLIGELDESFSQTILRLIDAKGKTDTQVYKRANLDRKLFSKIRSNRGYVPSKRTAVALAIALELSLAETDDLLERAGYALSRSQVFDVIVEYFIVHRKFEIFEINEVLFQYDQPLLGD